MIKKHWLWDNFINLVMVKKFEIINNYNESYDSHLHLFLIFGAIKKINAWLHFSSLTDQKFSSFPSHQLLLSIFSPISNYYQVYFLLKTYTNQFWSFAAWTAICPKSHKWVAFSHLRNYIILYNMFWCSWQSSIYV